MTARAWPPSFPAFQPPWWLCGAHAQTLVHLWWPEKLPAHQATSIPVKLADGDIVIVHDDCPEGWTRSMPSVLMMHGLAGSHRSPQIVRMTQKLVERNVRVFRLDLRGCGAGEGLSSGTYHAGRSEDLSQVVRAVLKVCDAGPVDQTLRIDRPSTALTLVGLSLGGNILLKYLGEDPANVPEEVVQAVAVNPPIDLAASVRRLGQSINRWYDRYFVSMLRKHAERHRKAQPMAPYPNKKEAPTSLFDFDNWYTAPMGGFRNAAHYYAKCSARQHMSQIRVPTVVLTSCDDPLVPQEIFQPTRDKWPSNVHLQITRGGGHIGYLSRTGRDPDQHWLDWRILEMVGVETGSTSHHPSRSDRLKVA